MMKPAMPPILIVIATLAAALGWIIGELMNRPILRRVCGPVFSVLITAIVAAISSIHFAFTDSILYSGATKNFVAAVVQAIDHGRAEEAHEELRKFDNQSIETYEGGAFLRWLREPTERLNSLAIPSPGLPEDNSRTDE